MPGPLHEKNRSAVEIPMKFKGNCVVAQSGGPTAVINASALGVIEEAMKQPAVKGVWSACNGIIGVLNQEFYDLRKENKDQLKLLRSTPASALGSNRYKIKTDEELRKLFKILEKNNIRFFFYIGGNDSMDTADKLDRLARNNDYEMSVMGVPKTVDNDLFGTDHCPGYGSVIKYLAATTMEVGRDTESMLTHEPVSVIEAMGRNTGWIAAGAALAKKYEDDPPHIILLPETVFDPGKFCDKVRECLKQYGCCTIVASEGVKNKDGHYIAEDTGSFGRDSFGHSQLGGAALYIKSLVEEQVKVKARYVLPTLAQRSAVHFASKTDSDEAYSLGREAVRLACLGISGKVAVINRLSDKPYRSSIGSIELSKVANGEHFFPVKWISEDGFFVKQEFLDYARPLIQGEVKLVMKDGLPVFTRLEKHKVEFN
jgi:ATP-dependent phosphofructokinase / diphosphate-dependent phosphofructokinase